MCNQGDQDSSRNNKFKELRKTPDRETDTHNLDTILLGA